MHSHASLIEQLGVAVDRETESARALLDHLTAEQRLLSSDPQGLEVSLPEKQRLLQQQERLAAERAAVAAQLGAPPTRPGMERLLISLTHDHPLHQKWQELMELARECQTRHQINCATLALRRHVVHRALGILVGAPTQSATYGANGHSDRGGMSRSWAKA